MDTAVAKAQIAGMRLDAIDWPAVEKDLAHQPYARVPGVLSADECAALSALYDDGALFRSRVVMERHRFGAGEYKYFKDPLPAPVAQLRGGLYAPLAGIANR